MSNHHHDHHHYRQGDHDHQSFSRPPRRRDQPFHNTGYGGGVSVRDGARSSSFHERTRRAPPPQDSLYQWQNEDPPLSPPPPSSRHPDLPYHNHQYPHESRNPIRRSPIPRNSNNQYRGGCPFMMAPKRERNFPQPDTLTTPQGSPPLPNNSPGNSPHHHRDNTHVSGPYKPVSSSLSPVKPSSLRPRVKPATAPYRPAKSPAPSTTLDKPFPSHSSNPPPHASNGHPQFDRKPARTLKCEKDPRRRESLLSNRETLQGKPASFECAPIARPAPPPSENLPEIPRRNERPQPNGSLPKSNIESKQTDITDPSRDRERAPNTQRESPKRIFKKVSRVPKFPDDELTSRYPSAPVDTVHANGVQMKEEAERSERPCVKKILPALRSVPDPRRKERDTPQSRAGAAAMQRALHGEQPGVKVQNDCNGLNGSPSSPGDPYDSEARSTRSPEHTVRATRQNIESSMADMKIADRKGKYSASEREQNREVENHGNNQRVSPNEYRRDRLLRGGNRGAQLAKRRTTDFDGSREPRAKRNRPSLPPQTVNVEDTTVLRRSRRLQSSLPKENTWETIKFEDDRVHALFLEQLLIQPMLLRLSFLGMSDGDLRTTLDMWKDEKGLPEPDERRLEINNNRIRHITDEVCTRISALTVVSLNLSCNLLTTIGGKIGLCSKLRFLNMSRNKLTTLPQELCDLTNLEVLNMSHNEISRLPSGLCRLKHLEVLSLAWNKLEVLPEDIAAEGAKLSDLDLSHNEKFHFFPRCTEHWTKLEVLHIPFTTIYESLSRREHRLRPAALVKELAGRKEDMFNKRTGLRSQSL